MYPAQNPDHGKAAYSTGRPKPRNTPASKAKLDRAISRLAITAGYEQVYKTGRKKNG